MATNWIERFGNDGNNLFFLDSASNKIYICDTFNYEIDFWGFAGDIINPFTQFRDISVHQDRGLLIPDKYHSFQILDLKKGNVISEIQVKKRDDGYRSDLNYLTSVSRDYDVYVIPYNQSSILHFNTQTGVCEDIRSYVDEFKTIRTKTDGSDWASFMNAKLINSILYVPLRFTNIILLYNIETQEYEFAEIGKQKKSFVDICQDGAVFWLSSEEGQIIKWDKSNGVTELVLDYSLSGIPVVSTGRMPFPYIFDIGEELLVFDDKYAAVRIDKSSMKVNVIDEIGEAASYCHVCTREFNGVIYSHCPYNDTIVSVNKGTMEMEVHKIKYKKNVGNRIFKGFIDLVVQG